MHNNLHTSRHLTHNWDHISVWITHAMWKVFLGNTAFKCLYSINFSILCIFRVHFECSRCSHCRLSAACCPSLKITGGVSSLAKSPPLPPPVRWARVKGKVSVHLFLFFGKPEASLTIAVNRPTASASFVFFHSITGPLNTKKEALNLLFLFLNIYKYFPLRSFLPAADISRVKQLPSYSRKICERASQEPGQCVRPRRVNATSTNSWANTEEDHGADAY